MLANLQIPGTIFCLSSFQIFQKAYFRKLKYLGQFLFIFFLKSLKKYTCKYNKKLREFLAYPLFKYLKKHTCKSEKTEDNFLLIHFLNI